jgi:hypothetical protein
MMGRGFDLAGVGKISIFDSALARTINMAVWAYSRLKCDLSCHHGRPLSLAALHFDENTTAMSTSRLALGLAAVALVPLSSADLTTTIDAKSNFGIWEGWGTSLAWWAQAFGTRDDLADLFFTTKTVTIAGQALPGLGFNIARYNAGACSSNTYNGSRMVVSPKMIPSRQMQGFWIDWASSDPTSKSWDWSVDAAQRAMLEKARDRGADVLELFSNSPMWYVTLLTPRRAYPSFSPTPS